MTYANFKDQVVGYLNRAAASVVTVGAQDLVLVAMNDARRWAQREYAFDGNASQVFVSLSMIPKSLLTEFYATPALSTAVAVKRIDSLFEYASTTVGATTVYFPTQQIELRRRNAVKPYIPADPLSTALSAPSLNSFAYVHGTTLRHTNLTTPTTVMADVITFLPDHDGGSSEDIFLTYYADWLKWTTLANLNVWLKDSERTVIDQNLVSTTWASVKRHDAQQAVSTDDLSLD